MIDEKVFCNKRSSKFATDPGSRFKQLYHGEVGADGVIRLVCDDVIDIQEKIQSFEPSTNIYNILAALSPSEFAAMTPPEGGLVDYTDMPKTYAEALQLVIDGQNAFMKLPLEVRQKFNNDFNQWFATSGAPEWYQKMGIDLTNQNVVSDPVPVEPGPIEKEVKE